MGTINIMTSDYITLSIKPYEYDDFTSDDGFMTENADIIEQYGEETIINDTIQSYYEADRENAETILKNYNFHYYHVRIIPGYYESLSIDIENNYGIAYDSYRDKADAQKEITKLKQCLLDLAGVGFVETFPGWCMSYSDYNETVKAINNAVKDMRQEVKNIPTWNQYERSTK